MARKNAFGRLAFASNSARNSFCVGSISFTATDMPLCWHSSERGLLFRCDLRLSPGWFVVQVRGEPALDFGNSHTLALMIVEHLIFLYLPNREVTRLRMGEIEPAHARTRPHCKRLRDPHAGVRLDVQ